MNYKILNLFVMTSGFYLTQILKFSPVYLFYIVCFNFFIIKKIVQKKLYLSKRSKILCSLILWILLTQPLKENFMLVAPLIISYTYYILTEDLSRKMTNIKKEKIIMNYLYFNIYLLIFEVSYRLLKTFKAFLLTKDYYKLKFGSFMYMDTNFIGFFILFNILVFYSNIYPRNKNKNIGLIYSILNILTLSKSTILMMFVINLMKSNSKILKIVKKILVITCVLFILFYFKKSWTLLSRVHIYSIVLKYLSSANFKDIIFGIGIGNMSSKFGIGPHSIFIYYIMEIGLIGFLLWITFFIMIYKSNSKTLGKILIPLAICALIMGPSITPYLYAILALKSRSD